MTNTSNAKAIEAIFVNSAMNDRSIISSDLWRVRNTDSLVAVALARTTIGVFVADRIGSFVTRGKFRRVGNADSLVTVALARTAVGVFVTGRVGTFDKLGWVGNADSLVAVALARSTVGVFVASRITKVDEAC
jgi:hypothetical protein